MSPRYGEFGPLELEILGCVDRKSPVSVSDLQRELKAGGKELAYTTVMTVVTRLHKKGALTRTKEGRQFLYAPGKGLNQLGSSLLDRVRRSLFGSDRLKPILALLDSASEDEISVEELKRLRREVDRKIKSREGDG